MRRQTLTPRAAVPVLRRPKLPWLIFGLLLAAAVAQLLWYYPRLPERVATHYGWKGQPDGWSSKQTLSVFYLIGFAVEGAAMGGLAYFLPRIPNPWINLSHKEYWLAPERRADSLGYAQTWMLWMACATTFFMLAVFYLILEANLEAEAAAIGAPFWVILGAFLAYVAGACIVLYRRFGRPPEQGQS